jgi:alanyl-tRNA synthetase
VTGHEAQDVIRVAETLKMKLDALEKTSDKEKVAGLKAFSVVCYFVLLSGLLIVVRFL